MSDIITRKHPDMVELFSSIDSMIDGLEELATTHKPPLNGDRYMTDRELSTRLKLSPRTLQMWRDTGKIAYIKLDGKILYPESAVQHLLDNHYVEAWGGE